MCGVCWYGLCACVALTSRCYALLHNIWQSATCSCCGCQRRCNIGCIEIDGDSDEIGRKESILLLVSPERSNLMLCFAMFIIIWAAVSTEHPIIAHGRVRKRKKRRRRKKNPRKIRRMKPKLPEISCAVRPPEIWCTIARSMDGWMDGRLII